MGLAAPDLAYEGAGPGRLRVPGIEKEGGEAEGRMREVAH